jgi:hypothetical protein
MRREEICIVSEVVRALLNLSVAETIPVRSAVAVG